MARITKTLVAAIDQAVVPYATKLFLSNSESGDSANEFKLASVNSFPSFVKGDFGNDALFDSIYVATLQGSIDEVETTCTLLVGKATGDLAFDIAQNNQDSLISSDSSDALAFFDATLYGPTLSRIVYSLAKASVPEVSNYAIKNVETNHLGSAFIVDGKYRVVFYRFNTVSQRNGLDLIFALDELGFNNMVAPLARIQDHDSNDLGAIFDCTDSGMSLRSLALTSLRDLFDLGGDPSKAGGDFSEESKRLGEMIGKLHSAAGEAFGVFPGEPKEWIEDIVSRSGHRGSKASKAAANRCEQLKLIENPGANIRVHGNLNLGNLVRSEMGWFLDDDGETKTAVWSSPIRDVSELLAKLEEMAQNAASERFEDEAERAAILAKAWVSRNREAFLEGYLQVVESADLVPPDALELEVLLNSFGIATL
ncbi:MAG: hypothetical protein HKL80_10285 [Acidimicrobiales bacterium]|nr:hypothetical protein [Acidimicrobiales bacterium]